jgi:hypothetical protein
MEKNEQKYDSSFEWLRAQSGYRWNDCEPCDIWGEPFKNWDGKKRNEFENLVQMIPDGPYLTEADPTQEPVAWKPLEEQALFARFADICPDEESLLEWANEYGRLIDVEKDLQNYIFVFPQTDVSGAPDISLLRDKGIYVSARDGRFCRREKADPLNFWIQEHHALSFAVMLWEMIMINDQRLKSMIDWGHGGRDIYIYKIYRHMLEEADFKRFEEEDSYKIDCSYGRILMSPYYQEGDTSVPWGEYFPNGKLDARKTASLYIQVETARKLAEFPLKLLLKREKGGKLSKALEPTSLLSAMWYQFYLAQAGDIRLRRCSICGRWEDMEGHRESWTRHKNCGNYARVKKAREKKRERERRQ